jgi:hypothetical protein
MPRRLVASLIFPLALVGQAPAPAPFAVATDKVDLTTLDGMVRALYSTISGPKGMKRDLELQRSLFIPGARLVAPEKGQDGSLKVVQMDIEGYMKSAFPMMEARGFFERETSRKVEQWGHIAHVWSRYESFEKADDKAPSEQGINTFQLVFDGHRWWVTGCAWDDESTGQSLPSMARAELGAEEAGTLDLLMKNLYGFISGPAGQKRDAAKIRGLFHPDCRFTVTGNKPGQGATFRSLSLDAFMERAMPSWEKGFFEQETQREVKAWGNMASVWTTYESRLEKDGPVVMRGINSLQLQWDGKRWWVMAIQFQNADENTKLPG